ncbi:hypothetical protein [Enhygromyxa salina]|uniref:hypothetical protein n=1 Tax=Enhygromyxa salina TaxID=215803 RepID=UPI0011B25B36|nr:hypothetical protein [Enhygromyxa salina]
MDTLTREAINGSQRPFQVLTCTPGGVHLGAVTHSFMQMIEHAGLVGVRRAGRSMLRWLIVERGRCPSVDEMADALSARGVEVVRRPAPSSADRCIADGRQALLSAAATLDLEDDPIVLLLDDDLAFDALYSGPDGVELGAPWPWLPAIWSFHAAHPEIDVALGGVTGAPPLPASSTLSTNLFDLEAARHAWPTSSTAARWSEIDHYYDLSPVRTIRDPYPMLGLALEGSALLDALMIHGTLARPLVATPTTLARTRPVPIVRGGNTIVFDRAWLKLPHPRAQLGGLRPRRADTIWAQAAASVHGCRLGQFPLPLRHLRDETGWTAQSASRWRERLVADLVGVGLYRGIERWRARASWPRADLLMRAANEVLETCEVRRREVSKAVHEAGRRCAGLLDWRPELEAVAVAINEGLTAITALDFGRDAIVSLLADLSDSLTMPPGPAQEDRA